MRKKGSPFFCLEKKMVRSKAWLSLKGVAPQMYLIFRTKCRMEKTKFGKREEWVILNNGEITFTYREAKQNFGITSSRFARGLDELIGKGFIDIIETGQGIHRLTTKYAISERWRKYNTDEFVTIKREKGHFKPGFQKKSKSHKRELSSRTNASYGSILVLKTGRNGKTCKTLYKLKGGKWLQTKTA
jgi:hypothetical protein